MPVEAIIFVLYFFISSVVLVVSLILNKSLLSCCIICTVGSYVLCVGAQQGWAQITGLWLRLAVKYQCSSILYVAAQQGWAWLAGHGYDLLCYTNVLLFWM